MEEKKGFSEKLNAFFAGKGFYIVLLLCAALIATSIWLMASGSRADVEASNGKEGNITVASVTKPGEDSASVPAMNETEGPAPAVRQPGMSIPVMESEETTLPEAPVAEIQPEEPAVQAEPAPTQAAAETAETAETTRQAGYFLWPVNGPVERDFHVETLSYDRTMSDWRTHSGLDISAAMETPVLAVTDGTVSAVYVDEMLGSVVEIDHGSGLVSVYANLQAAPAVNVGQRVSVGDTVGTVGGTALGEIGEGEHLHFAMRQDGQAVDPTDWLPER